MKDLLGTVSVFASIGLAIATLITTVDPNFLWLPKIFTVLFTAATIFMIANAYEHLK